MATLTGQRIKDSYKDLLQVSNSNSGIDSTLRVISDGEATDSVLQLSTTAVNISSAGALQYAGVAITSTAAELNILDGATVTVAELNILDGVTASATDINLIDGITNGTVIASKAIITDSNKDITGGRNITISGELDAATLDISGDADIDGTLETDALTIGGVTSVPFEAADHSKLDGIEASADVTDTANVTSSGALMDSELASIADIKALDQSVVSGATPTFTTTNFTDASNKRLMTDAQETKLDSVESNATADQTDEEIQDVVGAMFSSNTETGITATYQDGDGTIDLVVGTLNQDTTGTASKATVTDSTANTNFPVVFHDEGTGNVLLDDTGALRYNPSTGELLVPKLTVAGTTTTVDTVTMEAANAIKFEGATADANETILSIVDPTNDDNTQYLLNASGYIPLLNAVSTTVITATPTELNYVDGVTSNIQTQLDATLDTAGTGIDISSTTISVDVSDFMSNGADNRVLTATGTDAMNAEANLTFDGNYLRLSDNKLLIMGAGDAFQIGHKATYSNIATYEGHLYIDNNADDQDIIFRCDDGSGGIATYITLDGSISKTTLSKDLRAVDNVKITAGNADDLQLYHDGTNSTLQNNTGTLSIIQNTDNGNMVFKNDNGSGGTASYFYLDGTNERTQFDKGAKFVDNAKIQVGTGVDLEIYHNGTNSFIDNNTGYLQIAQKVSDADIFIEVNDGGGAINAIVIDSSEVGRVKLPNDNQYLSIGASGDLYFFHDGTNSVIRNATGDLVLRNDEADQDIILQTDDGSGGIATYITLDGSATSIEIGKKMQFPASHSADKIVMYSGGNEKIGTEANTLLFTADNYKFKDTNGDVNLFMNNSGQVGIGTNSPNMKLNISHGDQDGLRFNCTSTTGEAFIDFGDSGDNDAGSLRYDHNDNSMKFRVNASERMRITSAGNVGIGDNNPPNKLSVKGSSTDLLYLEGDGITSNSIIQSATGGSTRIRSAGGKIEFYTDGSANSSSASGADFAMVVDASQNVGIGTGSPAVDLHILDTGGHSQLRIETDNAGSGAYLELEDTTNKYVIANLGGDLLIDEAGVATRFIIKDSTGRIGIGLSSPAHILDVVGTAGLSTGTAWTNTSDKRIKTNVENIENGLDKILKLRPVSFNYTEDYLKANPELSGSQRYNSFIAQEYEEVFPDAVTSEKELVVDDKVIYDDLKQFTPHDLNMYLVKAIQEMKCEIDELKLKLGEKNG